MNAIVALCHFCDAHGPKVLLCTQGFTPASARIFIDQGKEEEPIDSDSIDTSESLESLGERLLEAHRSARRRRIDSRSSCAACDPFASTSSSGFISSEDRQSYISTQFPLSGTIFSSLRHACVRSLSCEVCPGREGPILYGDLEHGFSLSSTFFARDREARGLQRLFSVVVWMRDRSHLVNLTPTLLQLLEPAVFRIRQQSAAAFDASSPAPMSNRLLPSRGVMGFRTATAAAPTRSLATICGDELLFERLHQTFVLLLRAGAACMIEEDVVSKANRVASAVHRDRCQTITWRSVRVAATETVDLFELAEVLGDRFASVLARASCGDQIIVQSSSVELCRAVVLAFEELLPDGCCKSIPVADRYIDSYQCNLLGLPSSCSIPDHVADAVTVAVSRLVEGGALRIEIAPAEWSGAPPRYVRQVERIIEHFSEFRDVDTAKSFIDTVQHDWLGKAKLFFRLSRAERRSESDLTRVLASIGVGANDAPLVRFWTSALDADVKRQLLSAARDARLSQ